MSIRMNRRVVAKTANYTIAFAKGDAPGTCFTNRGATGAIAFTLPAPTKATIGWWYEFVAVVAFTLKVQGAASDQLVTVGDAAATAVDAATIGATIRALSDGTSWLVTGASVGTTFTVTA